MPGSHEDYRIVRLVDPSAGGFIEEHPLKIGSHKATKNQFLFLAANKL